jgi:hypothetical protein
LAVLAGRAVSIISVMMDVNDVPCWRWCGVG